MSLRVWLPLNGDLENKGLDGNVSFYDNTGAVINNNGKIGKCYYLDGVDDWLRFNIEKTQYGGYPLSFSAWVKCDISRTSGNIIDLAADLVLAYTYNSANNTVKFRYWRAYKNSSNTRVGDSNVTTIEYPANKWHHVVSIFDKNLNKIYVDGELSQSFDSSSKYTENWQPLLASSHNKLNIGKSSGDSNWGNIYVNDVRIYDNALSQQQIKQIAKGLILYYPLNRSNYGQENLLLNSNVEKSGKSNVAQWFRWNLNNLTLTTNIDYTLSFDAKISNSDVFYISLANNDSTQDVLAQGVSVTTEYKRYVFTKQTSKTNINSIIISNYKGYGRGNNNNTTGILYIKNIKLEIGNKNTPWCPNSSEILYDTLGLNNNIQYDTSGYQNNGTKHNITYDSDTSKYEVSSVFKNANTSYIKINENDWMSQGTEEMTINLWVNPDTSFSKFFSCTESGGWNTESGSSGYIRFPVHVYTNQGKTSTAYKYDSKQLKISDIPLDEWTMITFVYDETGTRTYINGQLHHTCSFTSYGIHYNTNARLFLGCEASSASPSSPYFNGKMSDFRIYATALSAEDILSLYNNEAEIDQSGIIHGQIR